jgi:hypothetical protein
MLIVLASIQNMERFVIFMLHKTLKILLWGAPTTPQSDTHTSKTLSPSVRQKIDAEWL